VPGAINLPHGKITATKMQRWPENTLFVVYCAGPHCNGTDRAAPRLGKLGRAVKVMIGGMTGWADEGFALANGPQPGLSLLKNVFGLRSGRSSMASGDSLPVE
jgi:rhodanese-related sulfurtransferase